MGTTVRVQTPGYRHLPGRLIATSTVGRAPSPTAHQRQAANGQAEGDAATGRHRRVSVAGRSWMLSQGGGGGEAGREADNAPDRSPSLSLARKARTASVTALASCGATLRTAMPGWVPRRVATNVAEPFGEGDHEPSSRVAAARTSGSAAPPRASLRTVSTSWASVAAASPASVGSSRRASASPRGGLERMQFLTCKHRCGRERGSHSTPGERWVLLVDLHFRHVGR